MSDSSTPDPMVPHPSHSVSRTQAIAIAVVVALLAFGAGAWFFTARNTPEIAQTPAAVTTDTASPVAEGAAPRLIDQGSPFSFADLVEHVTPAVVTVLVDEEQKVSRTNLPNNIPEQFRDFFNQFGQQFGQDQDPDQDQDSDQGTQTYRTQAMGSGFIIDPAGYIVTNNHVVQGATKISVKMPDGREFSAKLIGADVGTDVALIKVDGVNNLPTVAFGDDTHLRVGDWVVAVGNPFGLGGSVTAGIVSYIGRDIGTGPYTDYIQIDAPINRGNSGGPTFDLSGRVIGMNTAIFSPSGGSVGIGFAIPSSVIQDTVRQLKEHGTVTRGWLGVEIQNVTPDMASGLGMAGSKGAIVARVVANSPAAKAGVKQGDVVVSLNGADVQDSRDLTRKVASLHSGDKASLVVMRGGNKVPLSVLIAKRDESAIASNNGQATPQPQATPSVASALGMKLAPLSDVTRQRYGIDADVSGVVVSSVDPNSDAAEKGLRPGDVVVSIGMKPVTSPADIDKSVKDAKDAGRSSVVMLVATQQGQRFVAVAVDKKG